MNLKVKETWRNLPVMIFTRQKKVWNEKHTFVSCPFKHYLTDRFQRVLLNGQCSNWQHVLAGVSQGSILGPLVFLIYINYLSDGLKSNVKLFAADTSLLAVVKNKEESAGDLTNDLDTISKWAYNWKILFSPYLQKPTEEVSFSRKNSIHNSSNYLFQQC